MTEKSLISKALEIEEEKQRRLQKIDQLMGEFLYIVKCSRDLIWKLNEEYYNHYYPKPESIETTKQQVLNDPAIKYLLESGHVLPTGIKKHSKLFKNLAILFVQAGFTTYEIGEMSRKIVANCPGHKAGEIMSWVKHVQTNKNKKWEYNLHEVNQVFEEAGL
jgi:hypothetical protein